MSAVQGPMPLTAVSSACASSAPSSPSRSSGRPAATAAALARRVRIFGADRPTARRSSSEAAAMSSADRPGKRAARRRQMASALAVESCCDTMMPARPAKPGSRRRKAGRAPSATRRFMTGSRRVRARRPRPSTASESRMVATGQVPAYPNPHDATAAVTQPVLRFAPSPNGRLHLGHAYSALLNADLAQAWGGRFLLRIEDIDLMRCRPDFEAALYKDLAWLGL